jgi:hypothetical protein
MARRAGVPAATVLLGLLAAGPAFADVTVTPATAEQGSGQNLTIHVTNDGTQPIGKITLTMPADSPIAEVYPLSVEDWAPKIVMTTLASPLPTIHGGVPATQTAASIIWFAMPGKALAPGRSTDVALAVGPLPTLSSMQLDVSTTYTDGKPGPVMTPATMTLTPPAGGAVTDHSEHGGTGTTDADATGSADGDAAYDAAVAAAAQRGPSVWSYAGWVVAALALLGGALMMFRGRHRAEEDDEPDEDDSTEKSSEPAAGEPAKEPVTAGGKWSYRG